MQEMSRQRVTDENSLKLFEFLQNDLKSLSIETKKKFPHIKEVSIIFIVTLSPREFVALESRRYSVTSGNSFTDKNES